MQKLKELIARLSAGRLDPATLPAGGDPSVQARIDGILKRLRDPESGLRLAELNLVRRVRVAEREKIVYLDVPFDSHTPGCMACAGIAMTIIQGIRRELLAAFENEFPGYVVEFI